VVVGIKRKLQDGLESIINYLTNARNPTNTNEISSTLLKDKERRAIAKNGLGRKILDIKAGYSLRDTLEFNSEKDEKFYKKFLAKKVRNCAKSQMGYGRGIIVINERGSDLKEPMKSPPNLKTTHFQFFSGDMVFVADYERDLNSPRYHRPISYLVRGRQFHHSRVVDFLFVRPDELEDALYRFGGISLFDIIYDQLVNDSSVERSSALIAEKGAQKIYKMDGFKDLVQTGQEQTVINYVRNLETLAGVSTASIIDKNDEIETISLQLSGISEIHEASLRRVAMVTAIPIAWLIGENVRGLNSSGDNERQIFQEGVMDYQDEYLKEPLNELMLKIGLGEITFKEDQFVTPVEGMERHSKLIDNAARLQEMGLDGEQYLIDHGVVEKDKYKRLLENDPDDDSEKEDIDDEN